MIASSVPAMGGQPRVESIGHDTSIDGAKGRSAPGVRVPDHREVQIDPDRTVTISPAAWLAPALRG